MKKIIYTRPDGGISIVIPAPKEAIETVLGPMSQRIYEKHVKERSIPKDAIKVRDIEDIDIPSSREFRNAWADTEPGDQIDINVTKAKDIQLEKIRRDRDKALEALDKEMIIALGKGEDVAPIEAKKQALRNVTEPLKQLDTDGKVNDHKLLEQIRQLGQIKEEA